MASLAVQPGPAPVPEPEVEAVPEGLCAIVLYEYKVNSFHVPQRPYVSQTNFGCAGRRRERDRPHRGRNDMADRSSGRGMVERCRVWREERAVPWYVYPFPPKSLFLF